MKIRPRKVQDQDVSGEHVREEPDDRARCSRMNWPRTYERDRSAEAGASGASGMQLLEVAAGTAFHFRCASTVQ